MKRMMAVLLQRCPVCLEGSVFKSRLGMNSHCPHCDIKFERESGFFLMSMFVAYSLGILILIPTTVLLVLWNAAVLVSAVVLIVETTIIWPVLFRYSRILWLHADQWMDPRPRPEKT